MTHTHGAGTAGIDNGVQLRELADGLARVEGYAHAINQLASAALSKSQQSLAEKAGWARLIRNMNSILGYVEKIHGSTSLYRDETRARVVCSNPAEISGKGLPSLLEASLLLDEMKQQVGVTVSSPLIFSPEGIFTFELIMECLKTARRSIENVAEALGMNDLEPNTAVYERLRQPRQMDVMEVEARISGLLSRLDSLRTDVRSLQAMFINLVKHSNKNNG